MRSRARGGRTVREQGNVDAGKNPVVGRVLEDVEDRHGRGGESMDEKRFVFTFEEVEDDHGARQLLGGRSGREGRQAGGCMIDLGAEEVHEGMDHKRAEVLEDEDGTPCYLWAFLSSNGLAAGSHGKLRILSRRMNGIVPKGSDAEYG